MTWWRRNAYKIFIKDFQICYQNYVRFWILHEPSRIYKNIKHLLPEQSIIDQFVPTEGWFVQQLKKFRFLLHIYLTNLDWFNRFYQWDLFNFSFFNNTIHDTAWRQLAQHKY